MSLNETIENLRASERKLVVHQCSICGYSCGYQFVGRQLYYDAGCDCRWEGLRPRSELDLVNCLQRNPQLAEGADVT